MKRHKKTNSRGEMNENPQIEETTGNNISKKQDTLSEEERKEQTRENGEKYKG